MTNMKKHEKSCEPQLLDDEQPSHSWGLDKLAEFAQEQHRIIVDGEKEQVPAYWRLGQALSLARKQFARGQWGKYLDELEIHKTRASKARAIFRSFQSPKDVAGKSVEEAYGCRDRRQEQGARLLKRKPVDRSLKTFLGNVPKEAKTLIDQSL